MSHLIRDKQRLLIESIRPVKIGGIVSLCDLTIQNTLSAKEIVEYYPQLQILERCFGKARLEPLSYYEQLFELCSLEEIQVTDISNEVIPTIKNWRENANENRDMLTQHVDSKDIDDFIQSCDILQRLYDSKIWGYGLISGKKVSDVEIVFDKTFDNKLF